MPADRCWTIEFTLIAIFCVPLHLPAQQDHPDSGPAEQTAPSGHEFHSLHAPNGVPPSWNSSTRWNARLKVTSFHNSMTGWATVAAPAAGHRFNGVFSMEASIPIYLYRLANSPLPHPAPNATLVEQRCEPGDLVFSGHAQFRPHRIHYQLTGSMTAPTGDETYGLSSGRVTIDISNHLQRTFGRLTPTITAGAGDSTVLANRLVSKNAASIGPLAHFRAGLAIQFTRRFSFEGEGSEQLPLGDQKKYANRIEGRTILTVVTGRTVSERNGLTAVFDAVIDRHVLFSSYYSHSLKPGGDSVAVGLTYSLRSYLPGKDVARDDLFR